MNKSIPKPKAHLDQLHVSHWPTMCLDKLDLYPVATFKHMAIRDRLPPKP